MTSVIADDLVATDVGGCISNTTASEAEGGRTKGEGDGRIERGGITLHVKIPSRDSVSGD